MCYFCGIKNSLKGQFIWFLISHFTPIVSCVFLNSDTYLHTTSSITQEYSTWVLYIVFLSNVIVFLPTLSHFFIGTLSYVLIVCDFDCFVIFLFFFLSLKDFIVYFNVVGHLHFITSSEERVFFGVWFLLFVLKKKISYIWIFKCSKTHNQSL